MYTLVIAEFKHETNTFSPKITNMNSFARRRYLTGEAMVSALSGTKTEAGGFLDILQKEPDVRVVPAVSANAVPAGRGTTKLVMKCRKLPLINPTLSTDEYPMAQYVEMAHEYEKRPSALTVSVSHGFPCADIFELGITAIAVTDDTPETAEKIVDAIANRLWQDRYMMKQTTYSPEEAVREAVKSPENPVILADLTNNPGGGSTCDGTHILRVESPWHQQTPVKRLCENSGGKGPRQTVRY